MRSDIVAATAAVVAAYVAGKKNMTVEQMTELVRRTGAALAALPGGAAEKPDARPGGAAGMESLDAALPAVAIADSIKPDHLVCLEDGTKRTMLKRYLRTHYAMSPDDYRKKWGLPADYPMVAPNYARRRAVMARDLGLGQGRRHAVPVQSGSC